jgi:signal transduction histidine kinase
LGVVIRAEARVRVGRYASIEISREAPMTESKHIALFETQLPEERARYLDALASRGFIVDDAHAVAPLSVVRDGNGISVVWCTGEPPLRLSRTIAPGDLASVAVAAVHLHDLHTNLLGAEDARSTALVTGIVAHDANNELLPMMLTAHEVSRELAHATELTESLSGACDRLAKMIRRLMERRSAEPQKVNLNAALTSLLPMLRTLSGNNVAITLHAAEPVPPVLIDPLDLERIVFNLVANARDAMPSGGQTRISVRAMHAPALDANTGSSDARWALLDVQDDGVGMDEATLSRALEPFYTTKPQGRGTGLGLASVLRAVRAASGELRIHSEVGVGTQVQVWLPLIP